MIQVQNLNITHKKDMRLILQKFSCVFNYGDKVVIIGEEGNGKSTLLKWIYNPKMIENYTEYQGKRIVNQETLGYLPQELSFEDRKRTIIEFLEQEPSFWEWSVGEINEMSNKLHLPSGIIYEERKMEDLSGGERIKIQIVRLLLAKPTVLLLDEPSNDIDIETLQWLEKVILDWPYIVVYVSHDETLIENTANMVIHIERLHKKTQSHHTIERLPYKQYMTKRKCDFERQIKQAYNERREKKKRDEKLHSLKQSVQYKLDHISKPERDAPGRLMKKKMKAISSMEKRFERINQDMIQVPEEERPILLQYGVGECSLPTNKMVLECSLDKLYSLGAQHVLASNINLLIRGPEKICIVGRNGIGKTTLIRKIMEVLSSRKDICVVYMPQNYEEVLNEQITPIDYLDDSGDEKRRTKIRQFLGTLKYTSDEMERPIAELSEGQKAKLFFLQISWEKANILILDEPTRNLSPLSGRIVREQLARFPGAIISVSHDRKYISEVCDRVYELTSDGLKYLKDFNI